MLPQKGCFIIKKINIKEIDFSANNTLFIVAKGDRE